MRTAGIGLHIPPTTGTASGAPPACTKFACIMASAIISRDFMRGWHARLSPNVHSFADTLDAAERHDSAPRVRMLPTQHYGLVDRSQTACKNWSPSDPAPAAPHEVRGARLSPVLEYSTHENVAHGFDQQRGTFFHA